MKCWCSIGVAIAALIVATECVDVTSRPMPGFTVNLDLAPADRWVHIASVYAVEIRKTVELVLGVIPGEIKAAADKAMDLTGPRIFQNLGDYGLEMQGIAETVGIAPRDIVLCNLMYELTAKCTSIVANAPDGTVLHGRNLDFGDGTPFTSFLRSIAINVNFQRNNATVYEATTYVGYVGALTASRPEAWSVSIDEVVVGPAYPWPVLLSVLDGLLNPRVHLTTLLIREILENTTFTQAVDILGNRQLVAPVYLIMAGVNTDEGVVITRDRLRAKDFWWLDSSAGDWFLVETNYDHWLPAPPADDRRDVAIDCMNSVGPSDISPDTLYSCLSEEPVLNDSTTYTAIINNAQTLYDCKVRMCCTH